MISRVFQRLARQINTPQHLWATWVTGVVSGILVPLMLILGGWLIQLLLLGRASESNPLASVESLRVGPLFALPTSWLSNSSVLMGVLYVVAALVACIGLECISLLMCYRGALLASLDFAVNIQRRLFAKSGALAVEQGLSGQQEAMRDMLFIHVPHVREATNQWYRVFPRHIVQCLLLLLLALSLHVWISVLALVCALIVWNLYNNLEVSRRKKRPVQFERVRASTEQLSNICETAPLLASIHDHEDTRHRFESQLQTYREAQLHLSDSGIIKSPLMLLVSTVLFAFLLLVVAIRFMEPTSKLHIGELFVLGASVGLSIASAQRFMRAFRKCKSSERAAECLAEYLEQPTANQTERKWTLPPVDRADIVLDHVTFRDSSSRKLLEDISVTIKAGQLTAIVASNPVQANALGELILGFGRPASGRILIGGVDSTDADPAYLRKCSLWASGNGPLVNGSLEENLWAGCTRDATLDLMSFAKRMHVSDQILNLPDGLSTIVTPNEERLQPDHLFRLGLTRALIKNSNLVVGQEPSVRVKGTTESETLAAIAQLKSERTMLVVLTQRLSTLRAADQIIVLHEHRLAALGTHAELLEQSEIYRHINYIQFSPFGANLLT